MNQDFVALLRELSAAEARFLIVGAYALAHHARPRATGDLDLWIEPAPDNAARVRDALIRNRRALGRARDLADLEALGESAGDDDSA